MKVVLIYFVGLISHMTLTDGTETSVVLNVPDHVAEMRVYRAGVGVDTFDLTNRDVRIGNTTATATKKLYIADSVPRLKEITGCDIRSEIGRREKDSAVKAYVDHAGGHLVAVGHIDNDVYFEGAGGGWDEARCVACATQLMLGDVSGSVTIEILEMDAPKAHATIQISPKDVVVISNVPEEGSNPGPHFNHYFDLLDAGCDTRKIAIKEAGPCLKPKCAGVPSVPMTTETNSRLDGWTAAMRADFQRIMLIPTFECTNTGYP